MSGCGVGATHPCKSTGGRLPFTTSTMPTSAICSTPRNMPWQASPTLLANTTATAYTTSRPSQSNASASVENHANLSTDFHHLLQAPTAVDLVNHHTRTKGPSVTCT